MSVTTYWVGSRFVAEWTLLTQAGEPLTGAMVTGSVSTPAGGTAAMTVTAEGNVYTAYYDAAAAGTHAYRLVASGTGIDAVEGTFVVQRSLLGAAPITVDPSSDVGMVRLLATDLNETTPLFSDAQIEAFLTTEGGNLKRAAALALETIAVSEVLISKKITTQDLATDGPAVARELRERAKQLRNQADEEVGDPDDYGLDIVNFDPYAAYRSW